MNDYQLLIGNAIKENAYSVDKYARQIIEQKVAEMIQQRRVEILDESIRRVISRHPTAKKVIDYAKKRPAVAAAGVGAAAGAVAGHKVGKFLGRKPGAIIGTAAGAVAGAATAVVGHKVGKVGKKVFSKIKRTVKK